MGQATRVTLEFWILSEHLPAYMDLISESIDYDFDDSDEYAIRAGIRETVPFDEDRWFEYPLVGDKGRFEMRLASTPGSHVIDCRIEGDGGVVEKIQSVCDVLEVLRSRFYLLPRKFFREDVSEERGGKVPVYRRKGY